MLKCNISKILCIFLINLKHELLSTSQSVVLSNGYYSFARYYKQTRLEEALIGFLLLFIAFILSCSDLADS